MAKLYFMAGHGAGDPGACANGYQEAERVRALANRIAAYGGNNVVILDTNINYYASNAISSLNIPNDGCILEAHMDSATPSARGGHVIIKSGLAADTYDNALANMLKDILPGRSNMIVGRNDLANPRRAAAKGFNYRLVEFGFITNTTDLNIFNSKIDEIAKRTIECFQINASDIPSNPVVSAPTGGEYLEIDGSFGPATVRRTQQFLGTTVDGIVSYQPSSNKKYLYSAYTGCWQFLNDGYSAGSEMARAMQRLFGATVDGWFGKDSVIHMQQFLGVKVDASMGPETTKAWQRYLNSH